MRKMRIMKLDSYEVESDTRENFEAIEEYITDEVITKAEWRHAEVVMNGTFTSGDPYVYRHNSGVTPKDILITSTRKVDGQSSVGTVAVLFDDIDENFIKFTCTSPGARVRFFFGNFSE